MTQAAPSLWTHFSMFHRNVEEVSELGGVKYEEEGQVFQTHVLLSKRPNFVSSIMHLLLIAPVFTLLAC